MPASVTMIMAAITSQSPLSKVDTAQDATRFPHSTYVALGYCIGRGSPRMSAFSRESHRMRLNKQVAPTEKDKPDDSPIIDAAPEASRVNPRALLIATLLLAVYEEFLEKRRALDGARNPEYNDNANTSSGGNDGKLG
jgi:hypothetical protein